MLRRVDRSHIDMSFDDSIAGVLSSSAEISSAIDSLIGAAQKISDEYYQIFETTSGKDGYKIGSRFPTIRVKEGTNGSTMEIRWMRSVQGPEGRIRKTYLKGKAHQYNISKITKGAPEWEEGLVEETENQFAKIRIAYSALMKVRHNLVMAQKYLQKTDD